MEQLDLFNDDLEDFIPDVYDRKAFDTYSTVLHSIKDNSIIRQWYVDKCRSIVNQVGFLNI